MNMIYYVVHLTNGEIIRTGNCPKDWLEQQASSPGEAILEVPGFRRGDFWYVEDTQVVERPHMPIRALADSLTVNAEEITLLEGVPEGTEANISYGVFAVTETINDGTLELAVEQVGVYRITLTKFPYITWTGEFNAN